MIIIINNSVNCKELLLGLDGKYITWCPVKINPILLFVQLKVVVIMKNRQTERKKGASSNLISVVDQNRLLHSRRQRESEIPSRLFSILTIKGEKI